MLAAGSFDDAEKLWDAVTELLQTTPQGPSAVPGVSSVAWSPSECAVAASFSRDGIMKIWDVFMQSVTWHEIPRGHR